MMVRSTIRRNEGIALVTVMLIMLLISSVIAGVIWLTMTDQQLGGNSGDREVAFYGAEAGMEKLTADLGTLFTTNYAPTAAQVNALTQTPPTIAGVQYLNPNGTSGYSITFPTDNNGNPLAQTSTIHSGTYQGMVALLTPYTLTVTARTQNNSEAKFIRNTETVGVPVFQFGVFSQTDLSFHSGPNFGFGGRVATNGNLWIAQGDGTTLTFSSNVTALGEIIRTNLSNGWPTSNNYNGTVQIATVSGGTTYVTQGMNQGSLVGNLGTAQNQPAWTQFSLGTSAGMMRNYTTGVTALTLNIATPAMGGAPIDLIRRPVQGEDASNPAKLGDRYYSEASLRILLSDNPTDITSLPCRPAGGTPVDLSTLAVSSGLPSWYTAGNPLAASNSGSNVTYSSSDGYWFAKGKATITGYIEIDAQTAYGTPCGTMKDVTKEILNLGVAGRQLYTQTKTGMKNSCTNGNPVVCNQLPAEPSSQLSPSACADPSPNAVIRFERLRDNPSSAYPNGGCGGASTQPGDYWPNVLFDPREGNLRDGCPDGSSVPCSTTNPTLGGTMHYVELDVANLAKWFNGTIGSSGPSTKDTGNATNDFVVYFSDRRTNYFTGSQVNGWPPLSPSGKESGEYGSYDFVNPGSAYGCPNRSLDTGEDVAGANALWNYGQAPFPYATYSYPPPYPAAFLSKAPAITVNPKCSVSTPSSTWPGELFTQVWDARENPPLFFRRALKLVNGSTINMGTCPGSVSCGLTIAAENPVYVQGNFNAPGGSFTTPYSAVSIIADAISLLSGNWNDVNSFEFPYDVNNRDATTTSYRFAAVSGVGPSFPQPSGTAQDFGSDGGVHNFMRFLENWGGASMNFRGSLVNLFYNRQAVGTYKCCTTVYSPPTRNDNFDTDFLNPLTLPPRTPMFRDVDTVGFTQLILPNQ